MSIQLKKTLMIPKSSSKAANPTTDDTMAKENGQTLIYKTLCKKTRWIDRNPPEIGEGLGCSVMVKQYLHH
jgi:hypothetical protein